MGFIDTIKKRALKTVIDKGVELRKKGVDIDTVLDKFYAKPEVERGLAALMVSRDELKSMIEKEVGQCS